MAASVCPVGGYDCELFVSSVPEELKCGLCKKVAREPNLTSCCGEHFCKLCIEQNVQDKRPCPSCDTSQFSFINDKRDLKKILALKVRCAMKDRGCDWTDTLEQLDAHLDANSDNCQYIDVNCPNECEQPVQKRHLPTHLAKQCTKRDFFCQYCNFKATYEVVCNVHWPQCPFYPIPCPNGCEIMALERGDLDAHLMLCSLEEVECEFNHAGCKVKLVREEMKIHLADNLQRHVLMMNKAGQEKMEQKERKIKQLEAGLEEKDRQVQREKDQQIQKIREEKKKEIQKLRGERYQQIEELRRQIQEERNREIQTLREEKERQIGEMKRTRSRILCASAVCLLCILLYLRLKHEGLIKNEQERVQEAHTRHLVDDLQRHILKVVQEKMEQKERKIEELEARLEEKDRQVQELTGKIQEAQEEKDRQIQELREENNRQVQQLRKEKERQVQELEEKTQKQLEQKDEQIRELQKETEKERQNLVDDLQRHILMMNKVVQEKMEQKERKIEELEARLEEKDRQIQELEEKTQKQLEQKDEQICKLQKEIEKERQIREEKNQQLQDTMKREQERQTQATHAEVARVEEQLKVHVQEYEGRFGVAHFTMTGFQGVKSSGEWWHSPPVYTHPGGYRISIEVWPNAWDESESTHVSVGLYRAKGENDDYLKWPADCTITLQLLNQHRDQDHITVSRRLQWNKPTVAGLTFANIFDYEFIAHKVLDWNADRQTQYLKNDCLQLKIYRIQVHSV